MDGILNISIDVLAFIFVLSILISFHEFGHYLVARFYGVTVEVFSIGFGRELFGWTDKNKTRWKVCILPLGGYVKMYGDADAMSTPHEEVKKMSKDEQKHSLHAKPVGQRAAVAAAGPIANFLLSIVIFCAVYSFVGRPFLATTVGVVAEDSAAAAAGIQVDDTITAIDGVDIKDFEALVSHITESNGQALKLSIKRGEEILALTIQPKPYVDKFDRTHYRLGVAPKTQGIQKVSPVMAVVYAFSDTGKFIWKTLEGVGGILIGARGSDELMGPLRIAELSGASAKQGLVPLLMLIAGISISLGLINLFPVPALDGGHLVFYGIEAVIRKPLNQKAQEYATIIGVALILSLMVFAMWKDISHFIG